MKKVIIIGATSGMGRELAKSYASAGCLVCISGRRKELLDEVQHLFPDKVSTECFDVTGNENIVHLESMIRQLGGLDLLIYNSGFGDISKTMDWEIDKQTTLTNVNGFVEIANYTFHFFEKQDSGQIAAISSIASIRGNSFAPAYSASKAFISTYMEGLSLKAWRMKIPVYITDIQPGFVRTKMAKGNQQFWVAPVDKATKQIFRAIETKRRRAYITRRWWLVAGALRLVPYWIYKRFA